MGNKSLDMPKLIKGAELRPFDVSTRDFSHIIRAPDGKQLQVTEFVFDLLTLADGKHSVEEIANFLSDKHGMVISGEKLKNVLGKKIVPLGLLEGTTRAATSSYSWLLGLTWRHELIDSARLASLSNPPRVFFSRYAVVGVIILSIFSHFFFYHNALPFFQTISWLSLPKYGLIEFLILMLLGSFVHEFGHVVACRKYRCEAGALGFGIYYFMPVFFLDATEAWHFPRRQRVVIDLGGIYFQLIFILFIIIFYAITNTALLAIMVVALDLSIVRNINPFLKFDGYWALSDSVGIANLHDRMIKTVKGLFLKKHRYQLRTLPRIMRIVLLIYIFTSIIFFGYLLMMMIFLTPPILFNYPGNFLNVGSNAWAAISDGHLADAFTSIAGLAFPTLIILWPLLIGLSFIKILIRARQIS